MGQEFLIPTTIEGNNVPLSSQEMDFLRTSLSEEIRSSNINPYLLSLVFTQNVKSTGLMHFKSPNKFLVITDRSSEGQSWNKIHTLQTLSLFPHELEHYNQTRISAELRPEGKWDSVWVVPKFLREGQAILREKFRAINIHNKTFISQSPLSTVLVLRESKNEKIIFSPQTIKNFLLGSQIENYQKDVLSNDPNLMRVKYLEYLLLYISLCAIREDISPNTLINYMSTMSKVGTISPSESDNLDKSILEPYNNSLHMGKILKEADKIGHEIQKIYYSETRLEYSASLACTLRDKLRGGAAVETIKPKAKPITDLNRDIISRLIPNNLPLEALLPFANELSSLLFSWGNKVYDELISI
ncbi:hypothetical protein KBD69_02080 [Candidatus Woesebacteria bacterium]|nr:hypothetical protein [Candidatus Woesebacteria bacterium]